MAAEIAEQPDVLDGLVGRAESIADTVRAVAGRPPAVVFAARGSSANAALHGRLAVELYTRTPAMLEALSVGNAHGVEVDRPEWLAIGISQSGRTPEIVAALDRHRRAGRPTIAVTNALDSSLAVLASATIALRAGDERAVPATKTYTAQVAALTLIAASLSGPGDMAIDGWERLADAVRQCIADPEPVERVAAALSGATAGFVIGRSFGLPVAREGALKLKESTGIFAEGCSLLELLHGPIAVAGPSVPALVVTLDGPTRVDGERVVGELRRRGAPTWTVGGADADLPTATDGLAEPLAAIVASVRLQQLAHAVALARGIDPDQPHRLSKVTFT